MFIALVSIAIPMAYAGQDTINISETTTAPTTTTDNKVEMADGMRADGKIWVVVSILTFIVIGMLIYLALLDRKVSKWEQNHKNHN
jgi:uncharacterized membrane protein